MGPHACNDSCIPYLKVIASTVQYVMWYALMLIIILADSGTIEQTTILYVSGSYSSESGWVCTGTWWHGQAMDCITSGVHKLLVHLLFISTFTTQYISSLQIKIKLPLKLSVRKVELCHLSDMSPTSQIFKHVKTMPHWSHLVWSHCHCFSHQPFR